MVPCSPFPPRLPGCKAPARSAGRRSSAPIRPAACPRGCQRRHRQPLPIQRLNRCQHRLRPQRYHLSQRRLPHRRCHPSRSQRPPRWPRNLHRVQRPPPLNRRELTTSRMLPSRTRRCRLRAGVPKPSSSWPSVSQPWHSPPWAIISVKVIGPRSSSPRCWAFLPINRRLPTLLPPQLPLRMKPGKACNRHQLQCRPKRTTPKRR